MPCGLNPIGSMLDGAVGPVHERRTRQRRNVHERAALERAVKPLCISEAERAASNARRPQQLHLATERAAAVGGERAHTRRCRGEWKVECAIARVLQRHPTMVARCLAPMWRCKREMSMRCTAVQRAAIGRERGGDARVSKAARERAAVGTGKLLASAGGANCCALSETRTPTVAPPNAGGVLQSSVPSDARTVATTCTLPKAQRTSAEPPNSSMTRRGSAASTVRSRTVVSPRYGPVACTAAGGKAHAGHQHCRLGKRRDRGRLSIDSGCLTGWWGQGGIQPIGRPILRKRSFTLVPLVSAVQ
eukprot:5884534-Prymnesium_polylepis.2